MFVSFSAFYLLLISTLIYSEFFIVMMYTDRVAIWTQMMLEVVFQD